MADPWSAGARNCVQTSSSSRSAVLSIGRRPEVSMAAAKSLRRFANRLRETLATAGTVPSRVRRISARSSGIAAAGLALSFAKQVTAERRSRLRVSDRPPSRAS